MVGGGEDEGREGEAVYCADIPGGALGFKVFGAFVEESIRGMIVFWNGMMGSNGKGIPTDGGRWIHEHI